MKNFKIKIILFLSVLVGNACSDVLEEQVFSQLAPETTLTTEVGINSVLNSAYAQSRSLNFEIAYHFLAGMSAGEVWNEGGALESWLVAVTNYNWDSNHIYIVGVWADLYRGIREANIVIENMDSGAFSDEFTRSVIGEAKFIRAWSYAVLYNLYGPVPLYTTTIGDQFLPRVSDEEIRNFIESELLASASDLPIENELTGKATKGAALGVLTKHYLNTRQWQKAADAAKEVMDLGLYDLVPNYSDVFSLQNEGNSEILWSIQYKAPETTHIMNALMFPTDYPRLPTQAIFAARTYLFDDFVGSFEESDSRQNLILKEYTNTSGNQVQLFGNDKSIPFKFEFDPNAVGANAGNDIPILRYSDILLSRAEALNELNGPNQEIIDLINYVRTRAGATLLELTGYTQISLREDILREREWEFFFEGKAREDQLRHDLLIPKAQSRGVNARPFQVIFPIPQNDLDANPNLTQNEGY